MRRGQIRRFRNQVIALTLVLCSLPRPTSTIENDAPERSAILAPGNDQRYVQPERRIGVPFTLVTVRRHDGSGQVSVKIFALCYNFLAAGFLLGGLRLLGGGQGRES